MASLFSKTPRLAARRTVNDVLAAFNRTLDDLRTVRENHADESRVQDSRIEQAKQAKRAADIEVARADVVIGNIETLLGTVNSSEVMA